MRLQNLAVLAVVIAVLGAPGALPAQRGTEPFVFYGEEPWGGSYLGVDTRDVTSDRLSALHLKEESGVEVTMVDQDAPAGKSGLKEHDVILTVNDQKVESVEQLRRMIREIPPGRTVGLGLSRDGQPMTVKAQLAERNKFGSGDHSFNFNVPPVNIPAIRIPPINMPDIDMPTSVVVIHSPVRSGLMIENLTPQLGEYFGVKSGNGVLVRSVERGSKADQAGFHAGDVIVKVNGSTISDSSDFTRLLRERKENRVSVTVMRDRKEQNLTLTLPELKRSGSLNEQGCEFFDTKFIDDDACAEIRDEHSKIAALMPEISTAELRRIQPEMEHLKKQIQEEVMNHQDEVKEEMEKMQRDLRKQQEELKRQMKRWMRNADI